ncbi:XPG family DNA repair endonuclease [uncultured virus]|nr:XPG family DNA repair endonuclease [uncultured virus]
MTVKGLGKICKIKSPNCILLRNIEDFESGIKLAMDISLSIYRFVIAVRGSKNGNDLLTSDGRLVSHILGIFHKIINMLENEILPCPVFDGGPPDLKKNALNERKKAKIKAKEKLSSGTNLDDYIKTRLSKKSFCIKDDHIKSLQILLIYMGIPFIQSIGEADAQCAALSLANKVDGVITEDWDALPFGTLKMLKDFSNKKQIKEINLKKLLKDLRLTHDQFIELCILLGTDYCIGIKGMTPIQIYELYSEILDLEIFIQILNKMNKNLIKNGKLPRYEFPEDFLVKAKETKEYYLKTEVIDPEKIEIKWNEPNYDKLQEFLCNEFELDRNKIKKKIDLLKYLYQEYKRKISSVRTRKNKYLKKKYKNYSPIVYKYNSPYQNKRIFF